MECSNWCFKYGLVAKRFKNFRRFVYDYEAETFNGVNGATENKSGPKVFCKVCFSAPNVITSTSIWWPQIEKDNAKIIFYLLYRLKLMYPRPVASSSAQQSALWVRLLMWMKKGPQCTVLLLELRLSKMPWPSEPPCYVSKDFAFNFII